MNTLLVANFLGWLLVGLGIVQLLPLAAAWFFGEALFPYAAGAAVALVAGGSIVAAASPTDRKLGVREGFLAVGVAWVLASLVGSLPYLVSDLLDPTDALFESVSGFTTTGASVLVDVEAAPRALLLWRALTQWLGGMGIIVFVIALMPLLGVGGMQLFKTEMAGPIANKLTPRIAETARRLWMIYVGLTGAEWLFLQLAGVGSFDALCHALTTVSTGGFSTHNASVGGFDSPLVDWIVIGFMLLGGTNFVLHYRALTGQVGHVLRDGELRYFAAVVTLATLLVVLALQGAGDAQAGLLRRALFQVASVVTTTGYATVDFEAWPSLAQLVLLQLMVLGAMAGSTSGGLKSLRALIGLRALASLLRRQLHPHAVSHPTRYAGRRVPDDVLAAIWAFFTAYVLLAAAVAAVVAGAGYDLLTSLTAAATTLSNVGPGLGEIGPGDSFAHFPTHVKLVLSGSMIAGRLEIFTIVILFHPAFWRR